ncbi:hypothetical protein [Kitasatospora sp. NPDC093558]|uniref:hypothetical protein n=1 Tax=Kitasatospora sp. NPDC093558 TaxID=3155201 RepID=UPI003447831C
MTSDEHPAGPALRRVLAEAGGPELLDLLANGLSGTDLTTLLMEVFRRRADRLTPAEAMRHYRTDRFVTPAPTGFAQLRRAEDVLLSAPPDDFEMLTLAPLVARTRTELAGTPGIDITDDPNRATGRGYYTDLCYKIYATIHGRHVEIADGGFVDWTQRLTGSRKERLLISGYGVDRLATTPTPPSY